MEFKNEFRSRSAINLTFYAAWRKRQMMDRIISTKYSSLIKSSLSCYNRMSFLLFLVSYYVRYCAII
jgi:hypothetical protein